MHAQLCPLNSKGSHEKEVDGSHAGDSYNRCEVKLGGCPTERLTCVCNAWSSNCITCLSSLFSNGHTCNTCLTCHQKTKSKAAVAQMQMRMAFSGNTYSSHILIWLQRRYATPGLPNTDRHGLEPFCAFGTLLDPPCTMTSWTEASSNLLLSQKDRARKGSSKAVRKGWTSRIAWRLRPERLACSEG